MTTENLFTILKLLLVAAGTCYACSLVMHIIDTAVDNTTRYRGELIKCRVVQWVNFGGNYGLLVISKNNTTYTIDAKLALNDLINYPHGKVIGVYLYNGNVVLPKMLENLEVGNCE